MFIQSPCVTAAALALCLSIPTLPGAQPAPVAAPFPPGGRLLDGNYHHLGRDPMTGWPEVAPKPGGTRVDLAFATRTNPGEWTLAVRQRDVTEHAVVMVNGAEVALLRNNTQPGVYYYGIPPGALREGENRLAIVPAKPRDNMVIGPVHLYERGLRDLLGLRSLVLSVSDADTGEAVPARITIMDREGSPVEIFNPPAGQVAVRAGTIYILARETPIQLPRGDYIVYATRGMEWSRARVPVSVGEPETAIRVPLRIRREVDTTGFIATDTHLHTLTHSGHGDASVAERVITLPGDGVEFAIATDHNHITDYASEQAALSLSRYFTAVPGSEVSTPVGHINGFPLEPGTASPPHALTDWVQLVDGIRAQGARVVILNHPRGPLARHPFAPFGLNRGSGEFVRTDRFPFDAVEIANSGGAYEAIYLLQDWFALLNHGERVVGVAASDTHTVGDPAGWWRSYVPSATDDPAKIDVEDAYNRFLGGETSMAVGIFADIRVDGSGRMGQTRRVGGREVSVRLRVAAPSWVRPRRAYLFVNGQQIAEREVPFTEGAPTDCWLEFVFARPRYDAHVVAAIVGDGVDHPSAGLKTKNFMYTLAATNPVYLDVDGNGTYESPRTTAGELLSRAGPTLGAQWDAIMAADPVIGVQMASLLRRQTAKESRPALDQRIREAAARYPLLAEYARHALPATTVEALETR